MFYGKTAYKYILILKKLQFANFLQSGKIAHFVKAIKIMQKMTLNTDERCFKRKQLEKPLNVKRMTRF